MEIFPGDRHLRCSGCDQPYTLDNIWEASGCDCHGEHGEFECDCGNKVEFVLNLDYNLNKEKFVKRIFSEERRNTSYEIHVIKDILGEVLIRFSKEKIEIEFLDVQTSHKLQENKQVEECVVCYEECKTKTICNHIVCKSCYTKLKTCPYCRKDLIQNEILINDK